MTVTLELDDIQGFALSSYAHLGDSVFLFLKVSDGPKARAWLRQIVPSVANAGRWEKDAGGSKRKPDDRLNIAFTHSGLAALGLRESELDTFSDEFREGPTGKERSRIMGDTEGSAPEHWDFGGPTSEPVHILFMLFAKHADRLAELKVQQEALIRDSGGVQVVYTQLSSRLPESKEHFGYRDGISQPAVEGAPTAALPGQDIIRAGEFVLGYPNEYDLIPPMPQPEALGKNGTYVVIRKLEQDVHTFRDFLDKAAGGNAALADYYGAKFVGRWKSGAPLTVAPHADDPELGKDPLRNNNFDYLNEDPDGYGTPIGSHIRRSNPRNALDADPNTSQKTSRRHRIIRRGRPYGPAYTPETASDSRGTFFIAINADIKRQFEFVQEVWINDPKFNGLFNDKDPLVGDHTLKNRQGAMTIQRWPVRTTITGLPRFVSVRGAGYFFMPGIKGLKYIAGAEK